VTPSVTDAQVITALSNLLTALLPQLQGKIVQGQINRVSSMLGDYIEMWPLSRPRLATNYEIPVDCKFIASITPNAGGVTSTMAVTEITTGEIEIGDVIFGANVANNTVVQSIPPGGGSGDYIVSNSQTVAAEVMSAGAIETATSTEVVIQCDVHGDNSTDNAQVISQAIRSEFAVNQMDGTGVTPLFSDDPRQTPFITAANQYEYRWTIDIHLQITPTIATPIEFSDSVTIELVDVDVVYPDKNILTTDLTNQANELVVPTVVTGV
jgi:hypothetical protein